MKIEREPRPFRPVIIKLEYQHEVDQMVGMLDAARNWRYKNDALAWAIESDLRRELTGVVLP